MAKMGRSTKGNVFLEKSYRSGILNIGSQSQFSSGRRSTLSVTQSKKSVMLMSDGKLGDGRQTHGLKHGIVVYDQDGNDVTPKPLHNFDLSPQKSAVLIEGHPPGGLLGDTMSFTSFYPGTTATTLATASIYAQPFGRSIFGSTSARSLRSKRSSIESSVGITEAGPVITTGFDDIMTVRREEVMPEPTEEELNDIIDVNLEETDMIWMFDQKGIAVSEDSEDADIIREKNLVYEELCRAKEGNDRFANRGMQTFNFALKHKDIQADKVGLADASLMVTTWDMYDTYLEACPPPEEESSDESIIRRTSRTTSIGHLTSEGSGEASRFSESRASARTSSMNEEGETDYVSLAPVEKPKIVELENGDNPYWQKIIKSDSIKYNLVVMERVVTQNIYQPKQASYRGMEVLFDPDKTQADESTTGKTSPTIMTSIGPTLDRLWAYNCSITKGRNVSNLAWNKLNPDILAVGYGHFGFTEQNKAKGGLVCCWNIKNPEYPERVYHTKSSVISVAFSSANPNLLAVGQFDGIVCIYNVRNSVDKAVVDSFECPGKHYAPVWQLCWIDREKGVGDDRGEMLVSISADGRIIQWSIRKGFECGDLMKLKRTASKNTQKKKEKAEAFISRQAPGMCFDFNPRDSNMYLAGTEEGLIHKCSCSYNEQFLDTYVGHTGPLYKVTWSKYAPDVFLSCSADWSIRLWTQSELKPVLNFFSTTKVVHDVCWSPYSPTVFCAANEGAVEVWDLNINTLDPFILHLASPGLKFTCSIFSKNSNSLLVGDSDGMLSVYQLRNINTLPKKDNSLMSIVDTTLANQAAHKLEERKE